MKFSLEIPQNNIELIKKEFGISDQMIIARVYLSLLGSELYWKKYVQYTGNPDDFNLRVSHHAEAICILILECIKRKIPFSKALNLAEKYMAEEDWDIEQESCPKCGETEKWDNVSCGNCGFVKK